MLVSCCGALGGPTREMGGEGRLKVLLSGSLCLCDQPGHTGEGKRYHMPGVCWGCLCYSMVEMHYSSFLKIGNGLRDVHISEILQLVRLLGSYMVHLHWLLGIYFVIQNLIRPRYL